MAASELLRREWGAAAGDSLEEEDQGNNGKVESYGA